MNGKTPGKAIKDDVIRLRVTPAQRTQFEAAAARVGLDLSSWVRSVCTLAAKKTDVPSAQ